MKYENPTCEIVVLSSSDCLTSSGEMNPLDTPITRV